MFKFVAAVFFAAVLCLNGWAMAQNTAPTDRRVLIVSIDGMRPDVMLRSDTPVMHQLMHEGSYSMWARTTDVAITLPSHTSMVTGVTPARHTIHWNKDVPADQFHYPAFPTIMELGRKAGYTTAMVAGKSKFIALNKPGTIDWVFIPDEQKSKDQIVGDEAVKLILEHKPQVLFVHFPENDSVGHKYGWGSHEQETSIANADKQLGRVIDALKQVGVYDQTLIIINADHGGQGKSHGAGDMRSRYIPWIAVGPGVKKDYDLTQIPELNVKIEDTFATACWFMQIPYDPSVDGQPVTQIMITPAAIPATAGQHQPAE